MRKLMRSVAHNNMRKAGITNINKKRATGSTFSKSWRKYVKG